MHKGKVLPYFYICSFAEIISVVPEIQSTSLQTIQQLSRKILAWVKTTDFKLKSAISLERLYQEEKSDRIQYIGITFSSKSIKIMFLEVVFPYIIHPLSSYM